jgi:hypothetical protein
VDDQHPGSTQGRARFELSRATLDRAAERMIRNDPLAPKAGDRVGLYTVSEVHTIPGGAHILLEGSGDAHRSTMWAGTARATTGNSERGEH